MSRLASQPPIEPTAVQKELMKPADGTNEWVQADVTATGTTGIVGMYGEEDPTGVDPPPPRYFFLMELQPKEDITAVGAKKFQMWFQVGNSKSDWQGVLYGPVNSAGTTTNGSAVTSNVSLLSARVTNANKAIEAQWKYEDTTFSATLLGASKVVQIWHQVSMYEQTTDDQSIIRIETGRTL